MRLLSLLLALAVVTAAGFAQEEPAKEEAPAKEAEPVEVSVKLTAGAASKEVRIGYSKPRMIPVETNAPRFLFEIPEFKAKDPIFFRMELGETKGVPFYGALDRSGDGTHDLLYLDKDRDLDLTNDGEPVKARLRTIFSTNQTLVEFLALKLELPYAKDGKEMTEPYTCVLFFLTDRKEAPKTVHVERDSWRAGEVKLADGETYRLVMLDDDSNGQFTTSDAWALYPVKKDLSAMLASDATRSMLFPSWTTDQKWMVEVKSVAASGRDVTLSLSAAKETEHAFFLRIAKGRQSPEERALDIDPLRPKAGKNAKVDWIEGQDLKYALTIASSPRVQKPVMMFLAANTNRMSVQMDQYTFRDREIVALSKRFVCAKIDATKLLGAMRKRGIDKVPQVVFFTQKGVEIRRTNAGFVKPRDLAAAMKAALR